MATKSITVQNARLVVHDPSATWTAIVEAAAVVVNSPETTFNDLICLLKIRGLPQEWAAIALYKKTKRPCNKSRNEFVMDVENWTNYLKKEGFICIDGNQ